MDSRYGFIGLGNMGAPMAANLAGAGLTHPLHVYDKAGSAGRLPAGLEADADRVRAAGSLAEIAGAADTLLLSVPDGRVSEAIAGELLALDDSRVRTVIDFSTTGIEAAQAVAARLAEAGVVYVDAPVSGGAAGARAGTLTIIWGGPAELLEAHRPALQAMAKNLFHVGDRPGQGQAMKLLNNFLSATAMAATSEAMLFGLSQGLEMATMLDVVNVSTGRNTATDNKFPQRVLTGTFDAGFHTALMRKDVELYAASARRAGTPTAVAERVDSLWRQVDRALPGGDFTEIYRWMRDRDRAPGDGDGRDR